MTMTKLIHAALLALVPAVFSLAAAGCSSPQTEAATPVAGASVGVFTSDASGFDTHSWYLDTGREVVVFDAQFTPQLAEQAIASIRSRTASPIRWVVVTHPNPDKFNGASAFQAIGAKVVASKATAAAIPGVHAYKRAFFVEVAGMFSPEAYPREARVDVTFEGSYTLPLEAGVVRLQELKNPGVSITQTVAVLDDQKALVVGDLVHHEAHAWLEGGIRDGKPRPDLVAWRAALDELKAFPGYAVHGGRGRVAPVEAAVPLQQAYLNEMEGLVKSYVEALPDRSVLQGAGAGQHWKALGEKAKQRFPEHALPYLIEYGVYGLATSL
jgi:glyoxylase-like metal-dependent hydrolase (beta-lactamase superfamily II)